MLNFLKKNCVFLKKFVNHIHHYIIYCIISKEIFDVNSVMLPDSLRTIFSLDDRARCPKHLREEHGGCRSEGNTDSRSSDCKQSHATLRFTLKMASAFTQSRNLRSTLHIWWSTTTRSCVRRVFAACAVIARY